MFSRLVKEYADKQGVTEQLKAENQLEWVGKMNNIRSRAVEIIDVELICVQEDKAADIMLKVVACARILRYDTGGQEEYIYETIKMAFSNRPILQNLFGQATCPLWNQQQSIYVLNQNLSFAWHFTGFFNGYSTST